MKTSRKKPGDIPDVFAFSGIVGGNCHQSGNCAGCAEGGGGGRSVGLLAGEVGVVAGEVGVVAGI